MLQAPKEGTRDPYPHPMEQPPGTDDVDGEDPASPAAPPILKPPGQRTQRILNVVLAVAVPATIVWFVVANWDQIVAGPWEVSPGYLVLAGVLLLVAEGIAPFAWEWLMLAAGADAPRKQVWFVWFAVEPLKYLPVPIGPVVGRYALAGRVGLEPFTAVVTIAYDFVIASGVGFVITFPGLIWLAFAVNPTYRWAVLIVALIMLAMAWATLRKGGLSRLIADAIGHERSDDNFGVDIPRRALRGPALITLVMLAVRITANGCILAALTPLPTMYIPLYGLVFAIAQLVPLARFGAREGAIVIGLGALGVAEGPALLAGLVSRLMGLGASLVWLGISVLVGGGRRAEPAGLAPPSTDLEGSGRN